MVQAKGDGLAHSLLGIAPPGLVVAQGMNLASPGFLDEPGQHVLTLAAPQDQA